MENFKFDIKKLQELNFQILCVSDVFFGEKITLFHFLII